ncbi:hypothetical protein FH972_021743 [Carpinus fangiana]|uniref:J domain-containing protein n=1 Tax=Carpinus fangiana TaxID=176857 RepID=A0A5N6KQK2_9ROSI|nr:hypothetical protein FH972_021743 [Carpinus fangiana]
MAASIGSLSLPAVPNGWSGEKDFKAVGKLSAATARNIEPVGAHFLAEARRKRHKRTFSEDERIRAQEAVKKTEDLDDGEISEPEDPMMLQRDAKDWKAQDHYAVLGITKYRYKATNDQIKRANRKKVLKHHPDKRAAAGGTEDDSFFKCIQKATEVLLDPVKRRQYDSVDEAADVDPPTKKQSKDNNGKHFFKLWNRVFDAEGRFSKAQPVPRLGDDASTKDAVESFYNFWYNFDSWRSFEYLDEDVPDDSADRDQRRHVERKNFNQRKKKKAEDNARLRELVDTCLGLDERIARFRKLEKEQKNRKKNEREAAERAAAEEAAAAKVAADKAAADKEAADKAEREQGKKAKEAAKNAVKKNKRVVRGAVKDAGYFVAGTASAAQIDAALNDTDLLLAKVDADELAALTARLGSEKDAQKVHAIFGETVAQLTAAGKLKDGEAASLRT